MSGANCKSDGGLECASCNRGFKLRQDKTACDGRLLVRGDMVTRMLVCALVSFDHVQRLGTFMSFLLSHLCVCENAFVCFVSSELPINPMHLLFGRLRRVASDFVFIWMYGVGLQVRVEGQRRQQRMRGKRLFLRGWRRSNGRGMCKRRVEYL